MSESIGRPQNDARPGRLAFQGAYGAFSHEACLALRPWDEPIPFDTFEADFGHHGFERNQVTMNVCQNRQPHRSLLPNYI